MVPAATLYTKNLTPLVADSVNQTGWIASDPSGGPNPPPPLVSMITRSPAVNGMLHRPGKVISAPSAARTSRSPKGLPSSPPQMPCGGTTMRSTQVVRTMSGASIWYSRTSPSPPRCWPAPPEPRRRCCNSADWSLFFCKPDSRSWRHTGSPPSSCTCKLSVIW